MVTVPSYATYKTVMEDGEGRREKEEESSDVRFKSIGDPQEVSPRPKADSWLPSTTPLDASEEEGEIWREGEFEGHVPGFPLAIGWRLGIPSAASRIHDSRGRRCPDERPQSPRQRQQRCKTATPHRDGAAQTKKRIGPPSPRKGGCYLHMTQDSRWAASSLVCASVISAMLGRTHRCFQARCTIAFPITAPRHRSKDV